MGTDWNPEHDTFAAVSTAPARQRVLAAATRLFYEEGVRTVGIDQLLAAAPVTKATFYKYFGSRANLVREYIDLLCTEDQHALSGIIKTTSTPRGVIDALVEWVAGEILHPGYRGSALLNAAAAHPDRDHPVRVRIEAHDTSQKAALEAAFAECGRVVSHQLAATVSLLREGTHAAATLGDRPAAVAALRAAAMALLPAEDDPARGELVGDVTR